MKCPCQSNQEFKDCCEPLLSGEREATTPEELMRSRYSAFTTKNIDYIAETTDPQTRTNFDMKANEDWANAAHFIKLEILKSSAEGNKGLVEFKATFQVGDEDPQVHHEISKFRKQGGVWYFREGKILTE
jgi:SEC-C motif-containing protein